LISGFTSAFLRSIGGFALLLPLIGRVSIYMRIPKQRLMMPIGFCAIIGGTITLLGSGPLLILNDLIMHEYSKNTEGYRLEPLGIFTVFPLGCCILIAVIFFFWMFGNRLLRVKESGSFKTGTDAHYFRKIYGLGGRFYECRVQSLSSLVGLTLSDLEQLFHDQHIAILGVSKGAFKLKQGIA
jgi:di/tricarboxylate transporter